MRPFSSYSSDPLYKAITKVLSEGVKIAPPKGYGKDIPKNFQVAFQSILDQASKTHTITNAAFFDSGYYGVSFNIGKVEYVVGLSDTRMTKDDGIVMGSIFLQKTGSSSRIVNVVATDKFDVEFPSQSDISKIVKAISKLPK